MGSDTTQVNKLKKLQDTIQDKIVSNLSLKEMGHAKGFSSCVHRTKSLKGHAVVNLPLQPGVHDRD